MLTGCSACGGPSLEVPEATRGSRADEQRGHPAHARGGAGGCEVPPTRPCGPPGSPPRDCPPAAVSLKLDGRQLPFRLLSLLSNWSHSFSLSARKPIGDKITGTEAVLPVRPGGSA